MIKQLLGWLLALASLAVIVWTALHYGSYTSLCPLGQATPLAIEPSEEPATPEAPAALPAGELPATEEATDPATH